MDGLAAIQARIRDIESRFATTSNAGGRLGASDSTATDPTSFANALATAQTQGVDPSVPTSSGSLNAAGVDPVQWARDFLTKLGKPITSDNVRALTAWQQAEGTAAHFNPLATTQGGYTGETQFNSVGVKNYASYDDGLNANIKAITNGLYSNILSALSAGNDANAVAKAIANSPWGTGSLVERVLAQTSA
jgi:hypothetical protein